MALFVLKPKNCATVSSYEVLQDGALAYTVDASGCLGYSVALMDCQVDTPKVVLGAKRGTWSSKVEITTSSGQLVTTAEISKRKLCEIKFVYNGRQYRWAQKMTWTSCKYKFYLTDESTGTEVAVLKQMSAWRRASELTLHAPGDPMWQALVLLSAALTFKQGQESTIALSSA